jgi:hypothetical protein
MAVSAESRETLERIFEIAWGIVVNEASGAYHGVREETRNRMKDEG